MKRALGLYIPFLSTDRLRKPHSAPLATIALRGQALRIVHANRVAREQGIRPGKTLADAKAIVPLIDTCDDDPAADRRQLEALAIWAGFLSPIVHIEDASTLIVDVTGCDRLFGGEDNLLDQALDGLRRQGFSATGAIADTPGGAWALAHAHPESAVIAEPGRITAALASLPVWSLRIDSATTASLASVGVETVASLFHLPRSSLVSRFGEALLDRMDQATGAMVEVLTPYRPKPALTSRLYFGGVTTRIDLLSEAIRRALGPFCEKLTRQAGGVRRVFLTFRCPDVKIGSGFETRAVTLHVDLSQATRSKDHLFSLLRVALDQLRLPAPAESLMLWSRAVDPLDDWQDELFVTGERDVRELGDLLDRLAVRLGRDAVVRPRLLSDHQPERAFQYVPLVGVGGSSAGRADSRKRSTAVKRALTPRSARGRKRNQFSCGVSTCAECSTAPGNPRGLKPAARDTRTEGASAPRPLRLLPSPVEIAAASLVPEGPPISFRWHSTQHKVIESIGPERIETGWWRGPHVQRDYYRVVTQVGRRGWLFRERDTGRWFLHGWFD